jgi:hypothetical protein
MTRPSHLALVLLAACSKDATPTPAASSSPTQASAPTPARSSRPLEQIRTELFKCIDPSTSFNCGTGRVDKLLAEPTSTEDRAALTADRAAIEALLKYREIVLEFAGESAKSARPKVPSDECERRQRGRTQDISLRLDELVASIEKSSRPWAAVFVPQCKAAIPHLKECVDCIETHRATCKKALPALTTAGQELEKAGVVPAGRFEPIKTAY